MSALTPLFGLADGATDRWYQPLQAMLEHIVGGTALESLDGYLLTSFAGDHNKGHTRVGLSCQLQGRDIVKGRNRIACEDQVQSAILKRGYVSGTRMHLDDLALDAALSHVSPQVFGVQ